MKKSFLIYIYLVNIVFMQFFLQNKNIFAQNYIQGNVSEIIETENKKNSKKIPPKNALVGVTIYWQNGKIGTLTDSLGNFKILEEANKNLLIFSYIGYKKDSFLVKNPKDFIQIFLKNDAQIGEVVIRQDRNADEMQAMETMTAKTFKKSACCNLSESFETNASIDVSTSDAISGTKQIRFLGLDGNYAQIMMENVPAVRGLAVRQGLYFTSGSWIKNIDIGKGAGSVLNGYESITGQINMTLAQPENSEKLLINGYYNAGNRFEFNLNTTQKISPKWETTLMSHYSQLQNVIDQNSDGFMDIPKFRQVNFVNRWHYTSDNFHGQFGIKVLKDQKLGGQNEHRHPQDHNLPNFTPYGVSHNTERQEFWSKFGWVSPKNPQRSIGFILNTAHHDQHSWYGMNFYRGRELFGYLQMILQLPLGEKHSLKTGFSTIFNDFQEHFEAKIPENYALNLSRKEISQGFYAEHTAKWTKTLSSVAGLRADFHNLMGFQVNPRLHLKYTPKKSTHIRLSAGRGMRMDNPLASGTGYLASNRKILVQNFDNNAFTEIAWNYGTSISHTFYIGKEREWNITADFYRTDFIKQVVFDVENANYLKIYALQGNSYANSFQIQAKAEILNGLHSTLAYKYYDVKTDFENIGLQNAYFTPQDRIMWNVSYQTPNLNWDFDMTLEWQGTQRLPNTKNSPTEFQRPAFGRDFVMLNAQITRNFLRWEAYIGGENLLNIMQENPIINAQNPYQRYFDASVVYAPIMGTMGYVGVRFFIK
jgi:outer membrane receptor for ferrienterochelin and colicins